MNITQTATLDGLVSIIMPAYNAARYLPAAVESVLAQTYPHWELLITNDASTDETLSVARSFEQRDGRIRVLNQERNQGVAAARNRGLDEASGRYIAFLDSDDLWVADKLAVQVALMESEGVLVSYGAYQRIDEDDRRLGLVEPPARVDYSTLLKSNFIGNLTGMYNAEVLGKQPFADFRHEDYVAWLALLKKTPGACSVGRLLGYYRVYSGSTSSNKLRAATWQWKIYRRSESLGIIRSSYLILLYLFHAIAKRV